jgi:hypothetical protein
MRPSLSRAGRQQEVLVSTFLVVLDKAIPAQRLRYGLLNLVSSHKPAELVLLQTVQRLPGESEEEARRAARESVSGARSLLSTMGLPVSDAIVGDALPKKAIAQEMTEGRRTYDGIVLTSKPAGWLRLIQFDPARQLERKYHVPVICIEPEASETAVAV